MTEKQMEKKEYLIEISKRYSSRLMLKDKTVWEMVNLATMAFGKPNHCNTCGKGQRDIWADMQQLLKEWETGI